MELVPSRARRAVEKRVGEYQKDGVTAPAAGLEESRGGDHWRGMSYTLLRRSVEVNIGNSLYDEECAKIVKEIMDSAAAQGVELVLPVDFVV